MELDMDTLHSTGVYIIKYLQENFINSQDWFVFVSIAADLKNTFLIFFPIWFHLCESVGIKLIWVAVIGDWLNLIFKWILFGQRPYWWVHETLFYVNSSPPTIHQFPVTCETGPGSPSGHAMGCSAVYYVMASAVISLVLQNQATFKSRFQRWILWTFFWVVQINVCLSRVFVAAHFPHQVIAGVFSGMLVSEIFNHIQCIYNASVKRYMYTSLFLCSFALGFFLLLRAFGVDLLWTLEKAKRWCAQPEWIHIDTTPFAGLFRNIGVFLGLGLALDTQMYRNSCREKKGEDITFRLCCILTSLPVLHMFDSFQLSDNMEMLYYFLSFCKSVAVSLTTVAIVPYCVFQLLNWKEKKVL
ncbi:hypothetical protein GDO86_014177 [Hymenochirus boettgeri]|uniref:Glucose-6-phosphatase n=1 Tax=Hymenochirus boettgeri TaxID=247094 RepID=A0A8T2JSS6_9PIPI|nr:hypothetical protein GDO86_014177 [Hymenochirus boettgeri]